MHEERDAQLSDLLECTGLASWLTVCSPGVATKAHLTRFHSEAYVNALRASDPAAEGRDEGSRPLSLAEREEMGLVDDCAPFAGAFEYACFVAGASLQAADMLARGSSSVAINWGGGRHHAKRDKADGFCYINDVVLSLSHLRRRFQRVLYVDIDVHHGDGASLVRRQSLSPSLSPPLCLSLHN